MWQFLNPVDFWFSASLQAFASPALDIVFQVLTFLGNPIFWIAVAAIAYWRGEENRAFFLMNLIVITSVFTLALKSAFARPRPSAAQFRVVESIFEKFNAAIDYSMPSGHAVLASSMLFYIRKLKKNLTGILLLVLILVALSRVYLGFHYLSDVVFAIPVGLLAAELNYVAVKRLQDSHFRLTRLEDELAIAVIAILAFTFYVALQTPTLAATIFGFYAGFFLLKEMQVKVRALKGAPLLAKAAIGILGAAVIAGPAILSDALSAPVSYAVLFFAGFWISFLYPALCEKVIK